ncbi:MAG: SelT/SelW/SelH family protein [Myxococcales bacterium]|nr:SelT/SelW/SelH family protein [Myxococcales bacterium]
MAKPRVEIHFCYRCRWTLRASWLAQELLFTFESALGEVALIPSDEAGCFCIRIDGAVVHDRKTDGGFMDSKELKQRVRDLVAPDRDLGHVDRPTTPNP